MTVRIVLLIWLFASVAVAQAPDATSERNDGASSPAVTLEGSVSPVKATYNDLFNLVSKTRSLIASANAQTDNEYASESLRLQDQRLTIELPDGFSENDLIGAPEVAYDAYYTYYNRRAPISSVTIRLGDHSRSISVSGHSRDQVQALHGLLLRDLGNHSTLMGGTAIRFAGAALLVVVGGIMIPFGLSLRHRATRISCVALGPMLQISIWVLPWSTWFPGTAVFQDSASFIVRHSAAISLAGVLATLITFAIAIAYTTYLARAKTPQDEASDDQVDQSNDSPITEPEKKTRTQEKKTSTKKKRKP